MSSSEHGVTGTCGLCRTVGVRLLHSHIMSKWTYRRARSAKMRNPNPVHLVGGRAVQTSAQHREYLLCDLCEDRFGKWEKRAAELSYQQDGRAPLLDRVAREGYRSPEGLEGAVFADPAEAMVLASFALSIVWRAHVSNAERGCSLGAYAEPVRLFLLGEAALPEEVVVLLYFFEDEPHGGSRVNRTIVPPSTRRVDGFHAHRTLICGLDFEVGVGKKTPQLWRDFCLVHAPVKRILLEPTDEIIKWLEPTFRRALRSGVVGDRRLAR